MARTDFTSGDKERDGTPADETARSLLLLNTSRPGVIDEHADGDRSMSRGGLGLFSTPADKSDDEMTPRRASKMTEASVRSSHGGASIERRGSAASSVGRRGSASSAISRRSRAGSINPAVDAQLKAHRKKKKVAESGLSPFRSVARHLSVKDGQATDRKKSVDAI